MNTLTESIHISGLVVHCHKEAQPEVVPALAQISGCELHSQTEDGKLVVTLESDSQQSTNAAIEAIGAIDGVINTGLAYHRVEQL